MGFDHKKGTNSVFAIFSDRSSLERAVDELRVGGFRSTDISVLMQSKGETADFAHEKNTKAPEGMATGAGTGLLGGGILGWLAGAGALAIPGIGPFVAAGPIMGAIAGAGIGGAVGGITGGLIGLGIPEFEAKRYESVIKGGGMLLSVHVDDREFTTRAKDILTRCGGRDISVVGEASESRSDSRDESRVDSSFDSRTDVRNTSDYQDPTRRSGIDSNRLTDI
ncbi:MAG TPA: hypothetical protein VNJ08_11725 [Bacteriovoracaceae bacterium]|nr:hypothetical protein [Bacteriovoracaceae bacterium]